MSTARELVAARFGAPVNPVVNRAASSVGATAARLFINDPDRLGFLVVNLSANDLYIGPFPDVSATKGIKAGPSGGSISLVWFEDFEITAWEWFAIGSAAATNYLAIEYLSGR
jgi:hypothetical protein